ncbi:dTDP-4-dehydrorhamnose reductase [Paenibacillus sp. NEAU-GSW1]|uniref:dTDP-4-dehydrorhamnose reductase n=1 Tax=Paenibacillus sp. NEAU-GSW1 TaxID=2682486 RepID=UPI0012E22BCF|nr:dTDP-4-dehydrorhamnose reductase [Paenibacillus sp. NEAU-GSW1]MUT67641.1 dTDP-4-dehydrorhamnose reductase [Paenibacillus sp. NEAU-GSW1]
MKIVVTGAEGQLGRELTELGKSGLATAEMIGFGRKELDITDAVMCRQLLAQHRPDIVIHCAAYTAVDQAESDPAAAFLVNEAGTRNTAAAAKEVGAKFCYISTDYVFDGQGSSPYRETDRTNPQTVYGRSKLAGERQVESLLERYFIVRTSWVYGKYGTNFVKTMLKLGAERERLQVVADQIGSPTYTRDLAVFLLELVQTERYGIYHAANAGACSWYDFAKAIFEESGDASVRIDPCTTAEFPRPAPRPLYSVMGQTAIAANGLTPLRHWREALRHCLAK